MAESDKIRHGIEHWRTKASERAGEAGVTQLDSMVALLGECEHARGLEPAGAEHSVCLDCKWLRHGPTQQWEPVGFGR